LLVMDLFRWLRYSWFNCGWLYAFRNLSILSRFSSLLEYKFSKYSLMIFWTLLAFVFMSPFSSLILLIWIFALLHFVILAKGLSIINLFKEPTFCFTDSLYRLFVLDLISHCYFSPSASFGFPLFLFF
jgi:hypothetical protein